MLRTFCYLRKHLKPKAFIEMPIKQVKVAITIAFLSLTFASARVIDEEGEYYEGDIRLLPEQEALIESKKFTGIIYKMYRWPKNEFGQVVLPYTIDRAFSELC